MTAAEIVHRFQTLTAQCLDVLRANFDGIERKSGDRPGALAPSDGSSLVSNRSIGEGINFELHGRGCRFELATGEVLDVDRTPSGTAVFDSWRILMFARSLGDNQVDREALRSAASADPDLWLVEGDWFTWADRSHDMHWQPA